MKKVLIRFSLFIALCAFAGLLYIFGYFYNIPVSYRFLKITARDACLNLATATGMAKQADKVWPGTDGWLYYCKEITAVLLRWKYNTNNIKVFNKLTDKLAESETQTIFIPVPNKLDIYPEHCMPYGTLELVKKKRNAFFSQLGFQKNVIELFPCFLVERDSRQLYYQSDTHWNSAAKTIVASRICELLRIDQPFRPLSAGTRKHDTLISHSADLLGLLGDTSLVRTQMTCIVDSSGLPPKASLNAEVVIIGDSFGQNDKQFGGDIGSYLSHMLNTPVGVYCSSATNGSDFFNYVQRTFNKLPVKPRVVIIIFSSRKLLWRLSSLPF